MNKFPELFPHIYLGPQPTDEDVAELKRLGVKTVIDFRQPGETQTPNDALVTKHDLSYVNIGFPRTSPTPEAVEQLDAEMQSEAGPYLLHCGSGIRAITIYLLREAKKQGWPAERVEQEAKNHGYDLASAPELQRFVQQYLQ
jgi:uncharacterized protein (TIGR01244 family)